MEDTLAALHAAIIAAPTDRTVRLVYADALDESGDPAHVARAAFIRAQIRLESLTDDPQRATVAAQCEGLFADHWIDWWRPVCVGVGLPEPYVPGYGLGERLKRFVVREKRPIGAPYTAHPNPWSVQSDEYSFTAQFIAGFPEMLYLHRHTSNAVAGRVGMLFAHAPFSRLRFADNVSEAEWETLNDPHLAKLAELNFERLSPPTAVLVAHSEHLRNLIALTAHPASQCAACIRELVHHPTWAGLRSLAINGVAPPDAIQTLAQMCTLEELESLSFGISEVPVLPSSGGIFGTMGVMLTEMLSQFFGHQPLPPGPIRWPDYWPALAALARSPVIARLRTLRVSKADPFSRTLTSMGLGFQIGERPSDGESQFPDTLVRALAAGLNPDKLVRLELPAARLAPAGQEELSGRFGPRLVLV